MIYTSQLHFVHFTVNQNAVKMYCLITQFAAVYNNRYILEDFIISNIIKHIHPLTTDTIMACHIFLPEGVILHGIRNYRGNIISVHFGNWQCNAMQSHISLSYLTWFYLSKVFSVYHKRLTAVNGTWSNNKFKGKINWCDENKIKSY